MRAEIRKYLLDVREALGLVTTFAAGRSFAEYESDPMLRSAIERQLEIAGEALRQASLIEPALQLRMPDLRRIVAFRNRLAHGYASVAHEVTWGVVETHVPPLRKTVLALLEEA